MARVWTVDPPSVVAGRIAARVAALDRPRDGDGDGFVYDGTPRMRPYNPITDLAPLNRKKAAAKKKPGAKPRREARKPLSTPRVARVDPVEAPAVRDRARAAPEGRIYARVADDRLTRVKINQGDVIPVEFRDDDSAIVRVTNAETGRTRAFPVRWDRFDGVGVIVADEPDDEPPDLPDVDTTPDTGRPAEPDTPDVDAPEPEPADEPEADTPDAPAPPASSKPPGRDVDRASGRPTGWRDGARPDDDALAAAFTMDLGDGITTDAMSIRGEVTGTVRLAEPKDGVPFQIVGEFKRIVNDDGTVEFELFKLAPEHQGKGLGQRFFARTVDELGGLGAERIDVWAMSSEENNGAYTWARMGYDWRPGTENHLELARQLDRAADSDAATPAEAEAAREMAERLRAVGKIPADPSDMPDDFPTPNDVAMVGYTDDADTWLGKDLLSVSGRFGNGPISWNGTYQLRDVNEPADTPDEAAPDVPDVGVPEPDVTPDAPATPEVPVSGLDSVVEAVRSLGAEIDLVERDSDEGPYLELGRIVVPEDRRGEGLGGQAMALVTAYADETGADVFLTPSADFGGTKSRLERWYKSLGFKPNKGRSKDFRSRETMRRPAEPVDESPLDVPDTPTPDASTPDLPDVDAPETPSPNLTVKRENPWNTEYLVTGPLRQPFVDALGDDVVVSFRQSNSTQNHKVGVSIPGKGDVTAMNWHSDDGEIEGLFTESAWQRQGMATKLLDMAEALAAERGITPPRHSDTLTEEGAAWRKAMESRRTGDAPETPDTPDTPEPDVDTPPADAPEAPSRESRADRVARIAAEHDLDPADVDQAIRDLPEIRARIRADGAAVRDDAFHALSLADAAKLDRPPPRTRTTDLSGRTVYRRGDSGEWDWFDQLTPGEQNRLRNRWMRPASEGQGSSAPDQVAARIADRIQSVADGSIEDQMGWWLEQTRLHDAGLSMSAGRPPVHVGGVSAREVATSIQAEGIDADRVLGNSPDDAVAAIAQGRTSRLSDEEIDDAFRQLGKATFAPEGERPWDMARDDWRAEVSELEYRIENESGDVTAAELDRYDDLAPPDLREGGDLDDVFDRIRDTARRAGYDVRAEDDAPGFEGPEPVEPPPVDEPDVDLPDPRAVTPEAVMAPDVPVEPEAPAAEPGERTYTFAGYEVTPENVADFMPAIDSDDFAPFQAELAARTKAARDSEGDSYEKADLYSMVSTVMAAQANETTNEASAKKLLGQATLYERFADETRDRLRFAENMAAIEAKYPDPVSAAIPAGADPMPYELNRDPERIVTGLTRQWAHSAKPEDVDNAVETFRSAPENMRIRVPSSVVGQILADGRIKSQFETGTSSGTQNREWREGSERAVQGVPDGITDRWRPVYGYIDDDVSSDEAAPYGAIAFHVRPKVAGRTTVTFGDSLAHEGTAVPLAGDVTPRDLLNAQTAVFYRGPGRNENYVEAQYHGGLSLDDLDDGIDFQPVEMSWDNAGDLVRTDWEALAELLRTGRFRRVRFRLPARDRDIDPRSPIPGNRMRYSDYRSEAEAIAAQFPDVAIEFPVGGESPGETAPLVPAPPAP